MILKPVPSRDRGILLLLTLLTFPAFALSLAFVGTVVFPSVAYSKATNMLALSRSSQAVGKTEPVAAFGDPSGGSDFSLQIVSDGNQQKTIQVKGDIGSEVTLPAIKSKLGAADAALLQELPNQTWLLNANLVLEIGLILQLSPAHGVQELRLRSAASAGGQERAAAIDYSSFVYLRTHNGTINIDSIKIFAWDAQTNDYDRDPENGRAYITAKYAATMNIRNSEIGYLGSSDGESYGLTWRDVNDLSDPDELLTRVTGEVIDNQIHHNYYGIYTYQASNMLFRGNRFYENVRYGFDPHDFSHHFLVEGNQAHNNGAHGFIISRGCNNFIMRDNVSFNNFDASDTSLAHGFMLDPGSPNSADPQAPSDNNRLENNEAYGNEGYGLRILGANNNEIRGNYFHDNQVGISIEQGSTGNQVIGNRLNLNGRGVYLQHLTSKNMIHSNEIMKNSDHGVYVRSSHENTIENNRIQNNSNAGIAVARNNSTSGFEMPRDNQLISNTITSNRNGISLENAQRTLVVRNTIEQNKGDGVSLKDGATQNSIQENCLCQNTNYGIEVNGSSTTQNTWSRNSIYGNQLGGIGTTGGATLLLSPQALTLSGMLLTGMTVPGAIVEIFADTGAQGQYYHGEVTAGDDGAFSFVATGWFATGITTIALDTQGSGSAFSPPLTTTIIATPTPVPSSSKIYLPIVSAAK